MRIGQTTGEITTKLANNYADLATQSGAPFPKGIRIRGEVRDGEDGAPSNSWRAPG